MANRANNEIVSEEIKKVKTDIENVNDLQEELVNAEAEKFLLLFEKTFSKHKNILKEENDNLDCEECGITGNILTKIGKKIRETIDSEENSKKVSKATKFLKIIASFFHSIFDRK